MYLVCLVFVVGIVVTVDCYVLLVLGCCVWFVVVDDVDCVVGVGYMLHVLLICNYCVGFVVIVDVMV